MIHPSLGHWLQDIHVLRKTKVSLHVVSLRYCLLCLLHLIRSCCCCCCWDIDHWLYTDDNSSGPRKQYLRAALHLYLLNHGGCCYADPCDRKEEVSNTANQQDFAYPPHQGVPCRLRQQTSLFIQGSTVQNQWIRAADFVTTWESSKPAMLFKDKLRRNETWSHLVEGLIG